jgi:flagellar protein FlgJ
VKTIATSQLDAPKPLRPAPASPGAGGLGAVPAPPRFRGAAAGTAPTPPPVFALPKAPAAAPAPPPDRPAPAEIGRRTGRLSPELRKLRDATEQFEAFFVGYLLKQMRKTGGDDGGFLAPSESEKMFRDMMDDETARSIGKTRQFGIADLLYDQLAPTLQTKRETP